MSEQKPFAEVKPEEAAEIVKAEKTVLLDVRTPEEFANGHAEGAVNVPVLIAGEDGLVPNPDFDKQVGETIGDKKDHHVVCTCFAGRRGGVAAGKLVEHGFDKVTNIVGGMGAWAAAKLPHEGEINPPAGH